MYNNSVLIVLAACAPVIVDEAVDGDPHARRLRFEDVPDEIECRSSDGDVVRERGLADVVIHGLLADTEYHCTGGESSVSFTTEPLPDNLELPVLTVAGDPAEVGYHLTNVFRNERDVEGTITSVDAFLVIFDAEGRPRWRQGGAYGADTDVSWVDGRILVGGFSGNLDNTATRPTMYTLTDEASWDADEKPVWDGHQPGSWHHDAGMGVDGTTVHALEREYGEDYEGFVIRGISVETGATDWYWSSVLDGLADLPEPEIHTSDPWHANAVWEAEEDGAKVLYVSLKGVGTVLRIDEATRTVTDRIGTLGDWTLAGEGESEDQRWFDQQHDVKVYDGDTLVAFDNGTEQTRILRMGLDFATRTATVEQTWTTDFWYMDRWGGVDLVGDALDVARPRFTGGEPPASLFRVEPDGTVSWQITWEDPSVSVYRSETLGADDIFGIVE